MIKIVCFKVKNSFYLEVMRKRNERIKKREKHISGLAQTSLKVERTLEHVPELE